MRHDQHRQCEHGQRDCYHERRRTERVEVRRPQRLEHADRVAERDDDQQGRDEPPRRQQAADHTAVGGGLRFFLRSVAVPLVGFDAGYGIEARTWRFILIVGA